MNFNQVLEKEKDSKNIVIWYPFIKNSNILEIGANNLEITKLLLDKGELVTSIVFSEEIKKSYNLNINNDNFNVIFSNFNEIKLEKKYDYIILIEIIKYLKIFLSNSSNPLKDLLNFCKNNLSENGKILLATDNRLAIRNFCGNVEEDEESAFQNLQNKNENYKLYSKQELIDLIKKLDLEYKFYYPFPNLKSANVIFSENYLPKRNNSKINYNVLYGNNSKIILDEINLVKQLAQNGVLDIFANSFFIEIFSSNIEESNVDYIGFNNLRKEEYKTLLLVSKDFVIKKSYTEKSKEHINNLIENSKKLRECGLNVLEEVSEENAVKTKYISNEKLLDNILYETLKDNKINEFFDIVDKYIEECILKLEKDTKKNKILNIEIEANIAEQLHFLKNGFIDLVFENIFYENNEFIIYDQEWNFENIPLEFIIYRAITNLYVHNRSLEKVLKYDDVIKHYNLEKNIEIFNKVENEIQDLIVEKLILPKYSNFNKVDIIEIENKLNKLNNDNGKILEENRKLYQDIKNLQEENKKLNGFRMEVINSRSWKITQKIKSIFYKRKKI